MFFKKKTLNDMRKQIEHDEKRWAIEKPLLDRRAALNDEKNDYRKKRWSIKMSTSKLLILFLFLNCTLIEIFTGWAIVKMLGIALIAGTAIDFTPLVTLIGAVVSEVVGYAIYSLKATKENTAGGIVYDQAMNERAVG